MSQFEDTSPAPKRAARPRARKILLIGLAAIGVVMAALATAGYAGYQVGTSQRETAARFTQAVDLQNQYELGLGDMAAGRYEVAQARFEYILQLDPQYRDARQRLAQARLALQATATTTLAPPTPSATPSPTPSHEAADLLSQAQVQFTAGNWDAVIATLGHLHSVDAAYEAVKVDGLLYEALRNRGIDRIKGDAMETGIFDLDQAEAIGPLDVQALNYRAWARLYLAAQSYWGLNWQESMQILQQLYVIAPYFHDTSTRLYQATVNYAAQLARTGDACDAAKHYAEAQALSPNATVAEALATAQAACALTPTPSLSLTPGPGTPAEKTPVR
jgi:tetratricopeptide (TPR) repeat protein